MSPANGIISGINSILCLDATPTSISMIPPKVTPKRKNKITIKTLIFSRVNPLLIPLTDNIITNRIKLEPTHALVNWKLEVNQGKGFRRKLNPEKESVLKTSSQELTKPPAVVPKLVLLISLALIIYFILIYL